MKREAAPLLPSDIYRLALPSDPRATPGGRVFYTLAVNREGVETTQTSIWSVSPDAAPLDFTSGSKDRLPRPAPDASMIAFVSEREAGKRIYVAPIDRGGTAIALGEAYDGIGALSWSPDGRYLAFVANTPLDPASAKIARDEKTGAMHVRALPYKSDEAGLLDGCRDHLFVIPVAGGDARRITFGDYDVSAPAWSPDGARIAFCARIGGREDGFSEDLHVVDVASGDVRTLTHGDGPMETPAFSHDGREIAVVGHRRGDDAGGRFNLELFVVGSEGGPMRSLSATCDRPVADLISCDTRGTGGQQTPIWSSDDAEIYVSYGDEGSCAIVAFSRAGSGKRVVAGGERDVFAFDLAADGTLAYAFSTPTIPGEVATCSGASDGGERVLTDCNPWLAQRRIVAPRRLRPKARDGTVLDQWIVHPVRADGAAPRAPYVVAVHGGPHMAYGHAFMFEFQMLAGHGIGVAFGNPRGGQTYGHAFANAIVGKWGGLDANDVLDLLDSLLANADADPERIAIAGGSYGGFMTTWLLGHTKRFACGISMRAVNDFVSEVGASDLGWFLEAELDAPWSDGGRKLFEGSPMRAAHEIDVPLLVEHSERDFRCAIDQGEQLFTLLRRLGRTGVEFVRFSGDGHGLSRTGKPRNRVLRLRAIAHWLRMHLAPGSTAVPPERHAGDLFEPLETERTVRPAAEPALA